MGDFWQPGPITTLQALGSFSDGDREEQIRGFVKTRPVSLVLPCLYSEIQGPALPRIVEELGRVGYLRRIVVTLGVADEGQFRRARAFFRRLPQPVAIVWNDGARIGAIKARIRRAGLPLGDPGKGLAVWMALGYVLAHGDTAAVALHDTDIVTYRRSLLDRLVFPVVCPDMGYGFAKGYYARVTDRLHGRATRVFVFPLLAALRRALGPHPLLEYLAGFRYPLAGEFSLGEALAWGARIPADWGLEVGTLVEAYRLCGTRGVCQVDLDVDYEHKHQDTGVGSDRPTGLVRMAREIAAALFRALAEEGVVVTEALLRSLGLAYLREAREAVRRYAHLARANGLRYDPHAELDLAEAFGNALSQAGAAFLERPAGTPAIPSWERVAQALPEILEELRQAVEDDNRT